MVSYPIKIYLTDPRLVVAVVSKLVGSPYLSFGLYPAITTPSLAKSDPGKTVGIDLLVLTFGLEADANRSNRNGFIHFMEKGVVVGFVGIQIVFRPATGGIIITDSTQLDRIPSTAKSVGDFYAVWIDLLSGISQSIRYSTTLPTDPQQQQRWVLLIVLLAVYLDHLCVDR